MMELLRAATTRGCDDDAPRRRVCCETIAAPILYADWLRESKRESAKDGKGKLRNCI